jgi:hypothetical protein
VPSQSGTSSIWRVLTLLASATSGSTDDSSKQQQQQQPVHECDQGDADGARAAIGASTAELRDQLARHHIPATRRVCAYRLGCVAEVTAFLTADLTRFGLPGRIRPQGDPRTGRW